MNWRPDLKSLKLFVAVCDTRSIAKAAEKEAIDPSAVSKRLAEIEAQTGVGILRRHARGVEPTDAGQRLLQHARKILRETEVLQAELASFAAGVAGHVRLMANLSSGIPYLSGDLAQFLERFPYVQVDVQESMSPFVARAVSEGQVELGICMATPDATGLQTFHYGRYSLVLVVGAGNSLGTRSSVDFKHVMDNDFVALSRESGTTRLLTYLAATEGKDVNYVMYSGSVEAGCEVIARDLAVGIFPLQAVRPYVDRFRLKTVPLNDPWASKELLLYVRQPEGLTRPAKALLEHLAEQAVQREAS